MKKSVIAAIALCLAQMSFAQVSKNPGDFTKIKVFDRISVELIPAEKTEVVVTGTRSKEVEVVNNNGELKIRMSTSKLLKGEEIEAKVYYKEIDDIDASEGSYVSSQATFKQVDINLTTKEGADIKLILDVTNADIKSVTGGKIHVSGTASNQGISIGTGGIVEAKDLKTKTTKVSINAGGEADVNASEFVEARTKAGGTITIYGKPAKIDRKSILGGTIEDGQD
jgi:hypothetical protein